MKRASCMTMVVRGWAAVCAATLAASVQGDVIHRRGAEGDLIGAIETISDAGATIRLESGLVQVVPWDRVREVKMNHPPRELPGFLRIGEQVWRARTRLERGDAALAQPIFTELLPVVLGATNETTLIVAEGLLRCRLIEGRHDWAIIPALEAARIRRAGVNTTAFDGMPVVIDSDYALCTALAPVWSSMDTPAIIKALDGYRSTNDPVIEAMARLYRTAILRRAGVTPEAEAMTRVPETVRSHKGVALLETMIASGEPDAEQRTNARTSLEAAMTDGPEWVQAWSQLAIGRSLIMEEGRGRREQGLVALCHLPARFARSQPYLTRLALDELIVAAEREGFADVAAAFRGERMRLYPSDSTVSTRVPDGDGMPGHVYPVMHAGAVKQPEYVLEGSA